MSTTGEELPQGDKKLPHDAPSFLVEGKESGDPKSDYKPTKFAPPVQ